MCAVKRSSRATAALLGACMVLWAVPARAYSGLYSFGDSLSDAGNVYDATFGYLPAPPYYNGHFTNGPTWLDGLSSALGLGPVVASLSGGNDYAFGGAQTSFLVPNAPGPVPDISQQVDLFRLEQFGVAPSTALYTVWIGSNDVLSALQDIEGLTLSIDQAKADLSQGAQIAANAISTLAGDGAMDFLVGLVPNIGLTPRFNSSLPGVATELSAYYNQQLVAAISQTVPTGLDIDYLDSFSLITKAVADPGAFGLTNVTDACFTGTFSGGGPACSDPDTHLFWDDIHPTETGHRAITALALAALSTGTVSAVPLPDGFALYGLALVVLGVFPACRRFKHGRASRSDRGELQPLECSASASRG